MSQCRGATAGHSCTLTRGALVFVHPWPYHLAMVPFRDTKLHPDHIVVLESLERLVAETMSGFKGAWVKAPDVLQRDGSQAETAREGRIQSMRAMRAAGLPHRQAPSTNSRSASGALTFVLCQLTKASVLSSSPQQMHIRGRIGRMLTHAAAWLQSAMRGILADLLVRSLKPMGRWFEVPGSRQGTCRPPRQHTLFI